MEAERTGLVGKAGACGMNAREGVLRLRADNFELLRDLLGAVGEAGDRTLRVRGGFVLRET